jgi:hypothetical protein
MLRSPFGGSFGSFLVLFWFFFGSLPQNFWFLLGSFWVDKFDAKGIFWCNVTRPLRNGIRRRKKKEE